MSQAQATTKMRGIRHSWKWNDKYLGTIIENGLYVHAERISPEYDGGKWKFKGDGEIGYGYPASRKTYHCENPNAYYDCEAPAEVLGISATLYLLNSLCWKHDERGNKNAARWYRDQYYKLRDWAFNNLKPEHAHMVYGLIG